MRAPLDRDRTRALLEALGRAARGPGTIYLTGGTTAVLLGIRASTVDADLKLDPEPPGIFDAIRRIKDELSVNVELASPDDFIPPLPGWRDRSVFIERIGSVDFYHYDPYAQALAKIERGHPRDLGDVGALCARGLVDPAELSRLFDAIEPDIVRYPALDAELFRQKVVAFLAELRHG
jgi:hypothetical protein